MFFFLTIWTSFFEKALFSLVAHFYWDIHWYLDFIVISLIFGSLVFWAHCIFWSLYIHSVPCLTYSYRFSPILWVVSSVYRLFPLLCRNFLISCSLICQCFLLVAEPFEFYWGSPCLCLLLPVYCLLFPVLVSRFQVWYWDH
jgi:hypothetical protein